MREVKKNIKACKMLKDIDPSVSLDKIDWLADEFYKTKKLKYFNRLLYIETPYIRSLSKHFCKNSENTKQLEQELQLELWKLLEKWVPKKNMRFNYLMKIHLYNRIINFMKKHEDSFISYRKNLNKMICLDSLDNTLSIEHNFEKELENRDLVIKLMGLVDDKTKKIFEIILRGPIKDDKTYLCKDSINYEQVGRELGINGITVKRKLNNCRPIILKLLREH